MWSSSSPITIVVITLFSVLDLDVVKLPDSLYSYQHLKAFGVHNHIGVDPWNNCSVYFVDDKWRVMKAEMEVGSCVHAYAPCIVFSWLSLVSYIDISVK